MQQYYLSRTMVSLIELIGSTLLLAIGQCDLIGYNRLRNNVDSHSRLRNGISVENYEQQILHWFLANKKNSKYNTSKSRPTTSRHKNSRQHLRRKLYIQAMHSYG